jgi:hypothetical protein
MSINVFTGPRCRFTLNGVVIALGRSVQVQEELVYDPIKVLDSIEVLDHEPIDYNCSMSAAEVLIVGKTLEALGFAAAKGQTPQAHLANILALPDITAQLEDNQGDTIIARVFGVKISSKSFSVDARTSVARDIQFVARRVQEASEL